MTYTPSTTYTDKIRLGKAFVAGSGRVSVLLNQNLRATIQNPSGSGAVVYMDRLVLGSTFGAPIYCDLYLNPTTGLPSSSAVRNNNMDLSSATTSLTVVKADAAATALSGGTDTGVDFVLSPGRTEIQFGGLKIPANTTMGINIPVGALTSANTSITVYWWEE